MINVNIFLYAIGICTTLLFVYVIFSLDLEKKPSTASILTSTLGNVERPKSQTTEDTHNTTKTRYDQNWWKDPRIFEIERRAIFSKEWFYVMHRSIFQKAGDYRTFEIAGFSFVVILGKDKQLRTFHNVCRHRAYAVTKKEVGSSTVLGCRYHGWSYDSMGKLIKAPEFDNVEGFDKDANGLWELNTGTWESMVFVNFDNRSQVAPLDLKGLGPKLRKWNIAKMKCVADWKMDGVFNWKLLGSLNRPEERGISYLELWPAWLQKRKQETSILRNTLARRLASGKILFIRVVPKSPTTTTLMYTLFAGNSTTSEADIESLKREASREIRILVSKQRRLLRDQDAIAKVDVLGQAEISQKLQDHAEAEKRAGMTIHPASRSVNFTLEGKADDDFCRELEEGRSSACSVNAKGLLDW